MKYDIYIQDKFYAVIEAANTGDALTSIIKEIKTKNITMNIDDNQPLNIKVQPTNE